MSVFVSDEERASWTVKPTQSNSDEVICECIATSKSEQMLTKSKSVLVCSFVLKLVEVATGEEVTCYLKFNKSKKGHATVKHNSKFARLYRLTLGRDPRKRYSQAQHLVNHFLGQQFLVAYEIAKTRNNETYRKEVSIKPVNPIVLDGWTNTGQLRTRFTSRKRTENLGKVFDEPLKVLGKSFENSLTEKPEEPQFNLVSPSISNASKSILAIGQEGISVTDSTYVNTDSTINTSTSNNGKKEYTEFF